MKSIKRRFLKIQKKNSYWSSYLCFAETIKGQNFSIRALRYWFEKLVEKDDYSRSEKKSIIATLSELNKQPEESIK